MTLHQSIAIRPRALSLRLFVGICSFALVACSSKSPDADLALEVIASAPFVETVQATGELKSAEVTPLNVPGGNFESRELTYMVSDGSRVEKDEVVARFESVSSRKDLSQQELELVRNALKLANEKAQAGVNTSQVLTERADIEGQLALSERYADLDSGASWVSKNELLDKLQDLGLLQVKRTTADWRLGHQRKKSEANTAVTLAQRDGVQANVTRFQNSLQDLELRAPHAGIFRLAASWDGSKIQVGGSAWAGQDFASLPNLEKLIARFSMPQSAADGLRVGQRAEVRLAGTGDVLAGSVSRVGASASVRSRDNPVKYVEFDVALNNQAQTTFQLSPGQAVNGTVYLVEKQRAITVPNTALKLDPLAETKNAGDEPTGRGDRAVRALANGGGQRTDPAQVRTLMAERAAQAPPTPIIPRTGVVFDAAGKPIPVKIAMLGLARSEVLDGLKAGQSIRILLPELAPRNDDNNASSAAPEGRDKSGAKS